MFQASAQTDSPHLPLYFQGAEIFVSETFLKQSITLIVKVIPFETFATTEFTNLINAFIKIGGNNQMPPEIKTLQTTILNLYDKLSISFKNRDKHLNTNAPLPPPSCTSELSIFSVAYATTLIAELNWLKSSLPTVPTPLTSASKETTTVISILVQVKLGLELILEKIYREIVVLESVLNLEMTPETILAIQNNPCLQSSEREWSNILSTSPSTKGMLLHIETIQFPTVSLTREIIPTPLFGHSLDMNNVVLHKNELVVLNCIFSHKQSYTGCDLKPFNPPCSLALTESDYTKILKTCTFKENTIDIPQITKTGILFPNFKPFSITNSTLQPFTVNQQVNLPFHLITKNLVSIAHGVSKIILQPPVTEEIDQIETLNFTPEILKKFETKFGMTWKNLFSTYMMYGAVSFVGISFLGVLVFMIIIRYKNPNKYAAPVQNRRPVTVNLNSLL